MIGIEVMVRVHLHGRGKGIDRYKLHSPVQLYSQNLAF